MSSTEPLPHFFKRPYTSAELIADGLMHGLAIVAGLVGFAVLFYRLGAKGEAQHAVAIGIYAVTFFLLFGVSCAYNLSPPCRTKWLLRRCDHAAIFLMIGGAYTAIVSQGLRDPALSQSWAQPWTLAAGVWAASVGGAALAVLGTPGRYDRVLLVLYLTLGWGALLGAPDLRASLPPETSRLIVAGGVVYSLGVPFHLWNSLKYQNAIWHGFVAIASACQLAGLAMAVGHGG